MRRTAPIETEPLPAGEALRLDGVSIALGGRTLLALDALVPPGRVLTLMGPSGVGKSTLLALLAGFLDPAFTPQGRVSIGGTDLLALPPEARGAGLLFQDALLFPHMSVGQNLLFALPPAVAGRAARRAAAAAMLERVGLSGFLDRDPATLSGGEAQRAALARTLLAAPRLLLLDEPFSRLDTARRAAMRAMVFGLVAERAIPAVLVTHDEADASAAGGRVVRLGATPA